MAVTATSGFGRAKPHLGQHVVAHVAQVDVAVLEVGLAERATDRVGSASYPIGGAPERQAEGDAPALPLLCQRGDHRVVRIDDQGRLGWKGRGDEFDRVSHRIDLAEAIQLIAKEVRDQERPGHRLRGNSGQCTFVHLGYEHAVREAAAPVRGADGQAGDTLDQVRTGRIVADDDTLAP